MEAKYQSISSTCSEIVQLWALLDPLGFHNIMPPTSCRNTNVTQIVAKLAFHERIKCIEVDCHYIPKAFDHNIISLRQSQVTSRSLISSLKLCKETNINSSFIDWHWLIHHYQFERDIKIVPQATILKESNPFTTA